MGDFVHESQTLFENMMDKEPKLRLFLFSPAQQAIEFVGRALPAVRPEAKFTDEVPLMRPVEMNLGGVLKQRSTRPLAASGLALLTLGAGIITMARTATSSHKPRHVLSATGVSVPGNQGVAA